MTQKILSQKFCAQKIQRKFCAQKKSGRTFQAENVSRIDPSCAAMPYLFLPHTELQLQRQQETPFMLRNCAIKRIGPYIKKPMCDFPHFLSTQAV